MEEEQADGRKVQIWQMELRETKYNKVNVFVAERNGESGREDQRGEWRENKILESL